MTAEQKQFSDFITSQINYIVSLKTVKEKKTLIDILIKNMPDYVGDEMSKRITEDNLKYAAQQKTISEINNVLKTSLNALEAGKLKDGGIIKKSEMTVEQIQAEITKAKANPLLPDRLKEKYVAILEKRIAARTTKKTLKGYNAKDKPKVGDHVYLEGATRGVKSVTQGEIFEVSESGDRFKLKDTYGNKDEHWRDTSKFGKAKVTRTEISASVPNKITKVMHEFKTGKLKTSAGKKVTKRKQAIAIGLSEQRSVEKEASTIAKEHQELIDRELERRARKKKQ